MNTANSLIYDWIGCAKGQLNRGYLFSQNANQKLYPGTLLEGRAEILVIFGWHFGGNDDLMNSL